MSGGVAGVESSSPHTHQVKRCFKKGESCTIQK